MSVAKAVCPGCGQVNELPACSNCGNESFRKSGLSDGSVGLVCNVCHLGNSHLQCASGCGTWIATVSFGTATTRLAEGIQRGIEASQGGQCFISTELYGPNSNEVRLLRRFRDRRLLRHALGRRLVRSYYHWAPAAIPWMRRTVLIRAPIRGLVGSAVWLLRRWFSHEGE